MKDGIWLINKDDEVEYIRKLNKETKTTITYVNQHDEIVCVDKNYFKTYEELLLQATGYVIGSKVQYVTENGKWCKNPCELVKMFPNLGEIRRNPYIILKNNKYKAVDKIRLYDKRIIAIEEGMNS